MNEHTVNHTRKSWLCSTRRSPRWAASPSSCSASRSARSNAATRSWPRRSCSPTSAIDNLEREIEEQVISMIARRQPMADDLRHIMGALRITTDLERIGDLAKNIAKRALADRR